MIALLMRSWPLVLAVVLVGLAGCGKGEVGLGGSGTLNGEGAFAVKAAYFDAHQTPGDSEKRYGEGNVLSIILLPEPLTCEAWSVGGAGDAEKVGIFVSQEPPIDAGTYPFHDKEGIYSIDSANVLAAGRLLFGGELRLDVVTQDRAAGSFDAYDVLQDGGTVQLSGTFDAVRCETGLGE